MIFRCFVPLLWSLLACAEDAAPIDLAAECPVVLADPSIPPSQSEAEARRAQGIVWTDVQVRKVYLCDVAAIGPRVSAAKSTGQGAEAVARLASGLRHDARMRARAMMTNQAEVKALEARDQLKYGNPEGPTFEWLVQHNVEKGLQGDAIYDAITESAQRTNSDVNAALGL